MTRLQHVTALLAGALTEREVAETVIREGLPAFGATDGVIYLLSSDGQRLEARGERRTAEVDDGRVPHLPVERRTPARRRRAHRREPRDGDARRGAHPIPVARAGERARDDAVVDRASAAGRRRHARRHGPRLHDGAAVQRGRPDVRRDARAPLRPGAAPRAAVRRSRARRAQAEERERREVAFLATMSHELRTPLNAIAGHVQLLELGIHGPITDPQRESLARIQRAQGHLLGIINDVLDLAQHRERTDRLPRRGGAAGRRTLRGRRAIAPQAAAKGLTLDVATQDAATFHSATQAWADPERLRQVLLNLLSNAVKFTDRGGVGIDVGEARTGPAVDPERIEIRVRDTGIGIASSERDRISSRSCSRVGPHAPPRGDGARPGDQPRPRPRDGRRPDRGPAGTVKAPRLRRDDAASLVERQPGRPRPERRAPQQPLATHGHLHGWRGSAARRELLARELAHDPSSSATHKCRRRRTRGRPGSRSARQAAASRASRAARARRTTRAASRVAPPPYRCPCWRPTESPRHRTRGRSGWRASASSSGSRRAAPACPNARADRRRTRRWSRRNVGDPEGTGGGRRRGPTDGAVRR